MTDHLDRAAEVVERGTADESLHDEMCDVCEEGCCCSCVVGRVGLAALKAIDAAGLLVTPERDAAVAAKALREAADMWTPDDGIENALGGIDYVSGRLHEEADRIEREAGESDADA